MCSMCPQNSTICARSSTRLTNIDLILQHGLPEDKDRAQKIGTSSPVFGFRPTRFNFSAKTAKARNLHRFARKARLKFH